MNSSHSVQQPHHNADTASTSIDVDRPHDDNPPAYRQRVPESAPPTNNDNNERYRDYRASDRQSDPLLGYRSSEREPMYQRFCDQLCQKTSGCCDWSHGFLGPLVVAVILGIGLIILIVLIVSDTSEKPTPPGEFPESNYTSSFSQVIDPDIYTKLMLRLNQGILGNIVVSQSQDWLEDNIIIHGTIQSSTVTMLKLTTPVLAFKPNSSRAISIVSLNMSESDRKEAFDQQNWTRVDVQIMFPRHFEDFDALTIEHLHRGSIRIQDTAVQDTMMLLATDGNVVLQEIEVNRQLMVDARNGQVKGKSISAPRLVKVNAAQDVELELVSYSSRLDVRVVSKSYAEVVMTRPFYGHFLVETTYWLSYPKLDLTPYYVLRKNDSGIREGYTTWDGYEPALLPRIDIKGRTAKLKA